MLGNMPQAASCVSAGASDAGGRTAYLDDCFDLRVPVCWSRMHKCVPVPQEAARAENITAGHGAGPLPHRWLNGKCALHSSMWAQEHGAATHRRSVGEARTCGQQRAKNRTRRTRPRWDEN